MTIKPFFKSLHSFLVGISWEFLIAWGTITAAYLITVNIL
jgi:hypothetical protein